MKGSMLDRLMLNGSGEWVETISMLFSPRDVEKSPYDMISGKSLVVVAMEFVRPMFNSHWWLSNGKLLKSNEQ